MLLDFQPSKRSIILKKLLSLALLVALAVPAYADKLGEVTTAWKLIGANHTIQVEVFDDPRVVGVSCYISRAKTGGVMGSFGLAEDTSDASVACRQVGAFEFVNPLPIQEEVFTERASPLFKKMRVVRMVDPKRNVLTYLVYNDKMIEGSPKNSITAVPVPREIKIPLK